MIRRISKNNDLKDLIKSCPSGVIDDITEIRYFIQGQPQTEIVADFEKVGNHLEAILPTSDLETLSNGVLVRRAFYKVADPAYPDGYYNLEFVDDLDVWLGDEETEDPFDPGYLTEDDLKTINNQSIVGQGNINIEASIPDYYATKSWVSDQGYLTSIPSEYATQSWVSSQQFATQSWVSSQGYYKPDSSETVLYTIQPTDIDPIVPTGLIIGNYLEGDRVEGVEIGAGGLTVMCHYYQESQWSQDYAYQVLTESNLGWYLDGYATQTWVQEQGYITSTGISGLATQSWVSSNFLSTTALTGYASESWVEQYLISQSYMTEDDVRWILAGDGEDNPVMREEDLSNYATQTWVQEQGYITSTGISGLATQSWVESYVSDRNFATAADVVALSSWVASQNYATQSWVSSNFLESSKVWTGTQSEWEQLTSEQKTFYTIALVTE